MAKEMTTIRKLQPRKRETRHFVVVASGRQQGQNVPFLVFMAAISSAYPPKPKQRGMQKRKGRIAENLSPQSSNLPKILPKTIPKPSQTFPKPSQNPPQTFPNRRKLKVQPRKQDKLKKKGLGSMSLTLLGRIWDAQSLPREAQEPPKSSQNGAKNVKKWMLKNKSFSDSIFSWFGGRF